MTELSPMIKQYLDIKSQHKDHILMFRLGDFYEMFFDDAKLASKELELTLTGRDCGQEERAPMCGVPYHSCEGYIARLVSKGYKVAICEQMEDPALAKGIVKREVVRIITPGTVIDSSMLVENRNNYIASICFDEQMAGVAFCDISTGEVYATIQTEDIPSRIINELGKFVPSEIVSNKEGIQNKVISSFSKERLGSFISQVDEDWFNEETAVKTVEKQFGNSIENLGLLGAVSTVRALGAMMIYLKDTQKITLSHVNSLNFYTNEQFMDLDIATRRNLELCETMLKKEKHGSLLDVLDKTKTAMGARLIRKWIEQPLLNAAIITKRFNAVAELKTRAIDRSELIENLKRLYDLERLMTRVVYQTANGRDLCALSQTLRAVPNIKEILAPFSSGLLVELNAQCDDIPEVYNMIDSAITDEPPFSIREGGIIRAGYNSDLDHLRDIVTNAKGYIAKLEAEQREKTGIKALKVGYNKIFGYYIEVTKSYLGLVPETYIRKQTLANCERYIIQELKEFEDTVINSQDKITALEYEIFCEIRERISSQLHRIQRTASAVSQIDVLCSFSECADKNNYCMPQVDYSGRIEITAGRHPVVEQMQKDVLFVPNDTDININDKRIMLITGPNMAGKSTYMRQVALITLMSQIGSFVPAKSARIGICDKIFTRVGASDDLSAGQSTFMVEMTEVANILKNATDRSLVIYDEIGRGTSTFDGLSIAQSVLEYSADKKKLGAKVLFATHYHELTDLEGIIEGVNNYCIAVKKRGDDITFLRKIIRGAADDSYGIEVAKLAGVPDDVTQRAKKILASIECGSGNLNIPKSICSKPEDKSQQMDMGDIDSSKIKKKLDSIDINILTPIEGLNVLFELKKMANDEM